MNIRTALHGRPGRFAVVGVIAALVYVIVAWLLTTAVGWPGVIGSIVAYALAATFSYLGQRWLTFRSERPHREAAPRFVGLTLVGYAIAILVPLVLTDGFGARPELAIVVTTILVPIVTYAGLERLVFPTSPARRPRA